MFTKLPYLRLKAESSKGFELHSNFGTLTVLARKKNLQTAVLLVVSVRSNSFKQKLN